MPIRSLAWLPGCACALLACTTATGAPFTAEDLAVLKRVGDPQVSPNGRLVVYVQRDTDLEANRGHTSLWLMEVKSGATSHRLLDGAGNDSSPRWAPDGRTLYFLSRRSGRSQVWRLNLTAGSAQRVTDYPLDVGTVRVSPRGDALAITMEVFPDCATLTCTRERLDKADRAKASGRLYDRLFVRHWDTWMDGTRSHLFATPLGPEGGALAAVDVTRGMDADIPSKPFGGAEDFTFTPDGRALVFSARIAGRTEPWSTNFDLFQVPIDGSAAPLNLTADNPAADQQPVFLASGELAWLAQEHPGYEADRYHVVLRGRDGTARALTANWDRSVSTLGVTRDGRALLATVDELGQRVLYRIDPKSGTPTRLTQDGEIEAFSPAAEQIVVTRADLGGPADLYTVPLRGGTAVRLTQVNRELLSARTLSEFEEFSFAGANDEPVHGYLVKPYGFASGGHFPVALVVHGGPQVSLMNLWTYRWNAQALAGGGYAVVMIDFHGTPGYGQRFTDSIQNDWGGKPLVDLQKGLAAVLQKYPWLDGERVCALGASYGGFMMNWIEGNWPERFRCLVNHDGLFDQRTMYYSTEELWFPEHEFGGPYYENPEGYEKFNPVDSVARWRTPMLVVHGELDYRIPDTQGIGAFTALQRRGIESRLLSFPDENHWVLKPANSILWYHTVLAWLDAHLKEGAGKGAAPPQAP
jgi:dipeptidyl aminopeptidase/acylaminoacyl peptidase